MSKQKLSAFLKQKFECRSSHIIFSDYQFNIVMNDNVPSFQVALHDSQFTPNSRVLFDLSFDDIILMIRYSLVPNDEYKENMLVTDELELDEFTNQHNLKVALQFVNTTISKFTELKNELDNLNS